MSSLKNVPGTYTARDYSFRRKIQALLMFRLLMAVFFLLLTLLVQSGRHEDLLAGHLQPLYFFSVLLFGFTIFASLDLKNVRNLRRFAYAQLFFDVEAVTFLVFMSGGVESLFSFLYMPVIISASILLLRRGSLVVATLAGVSYGLLLDLQYLGWIHPLQMVRSQSFFLDSNAYLHALLLNVFAFYAVGVLSGYLAEELQKSSLQLSQKQKDLERLEALHRNIVRSMSSGLITVDVGNRVLYANEAALDTLQIASEDIRGRRLEEISPELHEALRAFGSGTSGEREVITCRVPSREGQLRQTAWNREKIHLGYSISAFHEEDRREAGHIVMFRDLTELKRMEEHVKRMERLAFAGRIAAEIAHEIKNPLASMSGAMEMLDQRMDGSGFKDNPLHHRLMDIVTREIQRINDLVTDFLWLSRGARRSKNEASVEVCAVVQEVLELLRSRDELHPMHRVESWLHARPLLWIDGHYFRQILWNLVGNALETMPRGGTLRVRVSLCDGGGEGGGRDVRIDVEDTGPGISEDLREKIFEPFFTTKEKGTGLGLSIVYQLVESAGGRMAVDGAPGGGARFSLFFPFFSLLPLAKAESDT